MKRKWNRTLTVTKNWMLKFVVYTKICSVNPHTRFVEHTHIFPKMLNVEYNWFYDDKINLLEPWNTSLGPCGCIHLHSKSFIIIQQTVTLYEVCEYSISLCTISTLTIKLIIHFKALNYHVLSFVVCIVPNISQQGAHLSISK